MALLDLVPADYNPRTITDEALAGLSESLRTFGLVQPIVYNERTGRIVGGHQRAVALEAQGVETTDVVVVDLEEAEEKALNLTLNSPAIAGRWTEDALPILEEIHLELPELADSLMLPELGLELAALFPKPVEDLPDDEAPEPPADPVTKEGDVWLLGRHRLICGDSTKASVVTALLGSQGGPHSPFMMVTDPPYGVEYDADWRRSANKWSGSKVTINAKNSKAAIGKVHNDHQAGWTKAYNRFSGDVAYVWHGGLHAPEVGQDLIDEGMEIRAQIVWRKSRAPISRGAYHWGHEACWYAVRKGRTARWGGSRKESTIWEIPTNRKNDTGHSTQKPVECMGRPMRNHGEAGDVIYDPFLGSGTTIIAAEQLDRVCLGIELDPGYCDVVVERWQELTGGKAVRA
jgi:DNA modification methylase